MRLAENSTLSGPHASGGPDSLDAVLLDPHGREMLERITRLYLIVHGRPPDPCGLRAYVGHLQAGRTLRDLAQQFVRSGEFTGVVGDGDPAKLVCRNALGMDDPGCAAAAQEGGDSAEWAGRLGGSTRAVTSRRGTPADPASALP